MAKIKIDDLPMLESLTPDEVKGIFGGTDPTMATTFTPSTNPNGTSTSGTSGTSTSGSGGTSTGGTQLPGPGVTGYTPSTQP